MQLFNRKIEGIVCFEDSPSSRGLTSLLVELTLRECELFGDTGFIISVSDDGE